MARALSLLLSIAAMLPILAACDSASEPDDVAPEEATTVSTNRIDPLPAAGGTATDVAIMPDGSTVAVIDSKLYSIPSSGGIATLLYADADYTSVVAAADGTIYAQTLTDLRVITEPGATPQITDVQVTPPQVVWTQLVMTRSDEPFMLVVRYPNVLTASHSTDGGTTWNILSTPAVSVRDIEITLDGEILLSSSAGIYRTSDRGENWTRTEAPHPGYGVELLVASNGDIYTWVPGAGGLHVSYDGGVSFTELSPMNAYPVFRDLVEGASGDLYGISGIGSTDADRVDRLIRSTDGGRTWSPDLVVSGTKLDARGNRLAVAVLGQKPGGVFVSSDEGETWRGGGIGMIDDITDVAAPDDGSLYIAANRAVYQQSGDFWNVLAADPAIENLAVSGSAVLAGGHEPLYSPNRGRDWQRLAPGEPLIPFGSNSIVAPAMAELGDGGFLFTRALQSDESGMTGTQMYRVAPDGSLTALASPGEGIAHVVESRSNTLYARNDVFDPITYTYRETQFSSTNAGTTWQALQPVPGFPFPRDFNSRNASISVNGLGDHLTLAQIGATAPAELTVQGPDESPYLFRRLEFGPDDRLYIVSSRGELWVSSGPVR